jgi:hypothetical protein
MKFNPGIKEKMRVIMPSINAAAAIVVSCDNSLNRMTQATTQGP